MHRFAPRLAKAALAAGAALLAAGCGGGDSAEETNAAPLDSNVMLEQPANDASAMESVYNSAEPLPETNEAEAVNESDAAGETSGGDTGGNTLDSNVAGM